MTNCEIKLTDVCDIRSRAPWPAGALSNFTPLAFTFDGVACASMEGLLQSFKVGGTKDQQIMCGLPGPVAQSAGRKLDWRIAGTLWWNDRAYDRLSDEYQSLLDRAYQALFDQSEDYRAALAATGEAELTHVIGKVDPTETILTIDEFCSRLTRLRAGERLALSD